MATVQRGARGVGDVSTKCGRITVNFYLYLVKLGESPLWPTTGIYLKFRH